MSLTNNALAVVWLLGGWVGSAAVCQIRWKFCERSYGGMRSYMAEIILVSPTLCKSLRGQVAIWAQSFKILQSRFFEYISTPEQRRLIIMNRYRFGSVPKTFGLPTEHRKIRWVNKKETAAQIFGVPPSLRFIKVSKRGRNGRIWSSHKLEGEICPTFFKIEYKKNIFKKICPTPKNINEICQELAPELAYSEYSEF